MWTLCDNTYNLVQAERTFAASIIICQDAGIAIEKYTVDLHLGTCDWCEDVLFFTKMTFREMKSLFMSSIAQIHHSSSIFHLSHTFWENMFLVILSSHRLGTTGKKPLCCVEEMHIFKASPSNSIRYKPVNFHVTHSGFQVYIANCINIYYYTSTAISTQSHSR